VKELNALFSASGKALDESNIDLPELSGVLLSGVFASRNIKCLLWEFITLSALLCL
jgi:hypothetical protein